MTQTNKKPSKRTSGGSSASHPARKFGYIMAAIVMIVMIYVLRHLRQWGFTFLTEDFENAMVYIELSLYISIASNILFIFYDNRWFKHLLQGVGSLFSALALIMIYVIFPFDIADETWLKWIRIAILVLFGLTVIGTIVEIIKGFKDLAKNPEKV